MVARVALGALLVAAGCGGPTAYRNHGIPAGLAPRAEGDRSSEGSDARVDLDDGNSELVAGGIRLVRAEEAAPAPPFRLVDEDGVAHTPASLFGRVVWIDVWADWCVTCRAEFPDVQRLHDRYAGTGLTVLATCRHSTRAGFEAAVRKDWIDFAVVDANEADHFPFPVAAFPTSVVLDRGGRVRAYWTGHRPMDGVEGLLRTLLAEPVPAGEPQPTADGHAAVLSPPLEGAPSAPRSSEGVVRGILELPRHPVAPGGLVDGRLTLDLDPGWHVLADTTDGAIPLAVRLAVDPAGAVFDVLRPRPEQRALAGALRPVYSGRVEIPVWGIVPADAPPGSPVELALVATIQACDDTSCLLPADIELAGRVWVEDGPPEAP